MFAWIVKDIAIDHHLRLIGNLTRVDGVFIGPLYYYVLVPFFVVFNMNPMVAIIPTTLFALFTMISIYFVFSSFFGKKTGLVGAFFYAVSISMSFIDRSPIPTQPTILWSVWLLYVLFHLLRGNQRVLPLAGILIGLIWHIHIVFLPLILLFPIAFLLSREKLDLKRVLISLLLLIVLMLPFFAFEIRHGFQQTSSLFSAISHDRGEPNGLERFSIIISGSAGALKRVFVEGRIPPFLTYAILFCLISYSKSKKILSIGQIIIIVLWIVLNLIGQQFSKRPISDYYFNNLTTIPLLLFSLVVSYLMTREKIIKFGIYFLILTFFSVNLFLLFSKPSFNNTFAEKKRMVEYIKTDVEKNNYPCVGINFIAAPGTGVGFRYLLWLNKIKEIRGGSDVPVYNITIPYLSLEKERRFGFNGVLVPENVDFNDQNICRDPDRQLLPLLGFTS